MWRNETKADIQAREAKVQQQYAKKLNSNPYWNVGRYQQTHDTTKAAKEYQEKQAIKIAEEGFRKREAERKEKEKQDFTDKIASAQNDEKAFTPAELYEAGIEARKEGDGVEATMRLWQALICGEGRAAYPLFEILRDGEAGIPPNPEMAGMVLYTGKLFGSQECRAHTDKSVKGPGLGVYKALLHICYYSKEHIVNQNKKITDKILFEREAAANDALDDLCLNTRATKQPMLDVFQHPILVADDQKHEETPLIGDELKQKFATITF